MFDEKVENICGFLGPTVKLRSDDRICGCYCLHGVVDDIQTTGPFVIFCV